VTLAGLPYLRRIRVGPEMVRQHQDEHASRATSVLRPVVFGANDGLVSNLALVMGVAGATSEPAVIVLAGIAGLLAGAFSMGVGEYVSVQSQRELLGYQMALERRQIRDHPEVERSILVEAYVTRGFTLAEATHFTERVFDDEEHAVSVLLHEEVGLDARSIGSPLGAAVGSFLAFTLGALIPLVPYLLLAGTLAFGTSLGVSLVALALLGLGISRLTRRSAPYSAARQVLLGGVAAAVTYAVGAFVGVRV
jgi:VIT1/CCC1 family predicted Fe2+/Mn2+ transporter